MLRDEGLFPPSRDKSFMLSTTKALTPVQYQQCNISFLCNLRRLVCPSFQKHTCSPRNCLFCYLLELTLRKMANHAARDIIIVHSLLTCLFSLCWAHFLCHFETVCGLWFCWSCVPDTSAAWGHGMAKCCPSAWPRNNCSDVISTQLLPVCLEQLHTVLSDCLPFHLFSQSERNKKIAQSNMWEGGSEWQWHVWALALIQIFRALKKLPVATNGLTFFLSQCLKRGQTNIGECGSNKQGLLYNST